MAFTTIQGLASNGSARANSSVTIYTDVWTLASAPVAGNFFVVAFYSNRGYPFAQNIQSVTVGANGAGATTMYLLDDGVSTGGGSYLIVYGVYLAATANGTSVVVKWKNQLGGTATLSLAAMEFSGASSVSTPANAVLHRYGGGLIDSGSPGIVAYYLAPGGTLTYNGNGSELTISATYWSAFGNPIPIVGSLITITGSTVTALNNVPMLVKSVSGSTIVVNSTYNGSATEGSANVTIYGSVVEQSATMGSGSQYPTAAFGILQWPGTSRIMTSYSAQKQPWIGAFVQNVTLSGTRVRMTSAGCTIPTSGSFTIPVASTTGAAGSGKLILHTQNGNVVVTFTSVTANTSFNGCTVNTYPSVSTTVAGYSYLTYPTSTTMPLLGVFPDASVYNPSILGGLTNGDSTPTSTSNFPYYTIALATGGTVTGSIVLMGGYATSGTYSNIYAIGEVNSQATSNSPFGGIWTFVPSTRALTPENASAVRNFASSALRAVNRTKVASAVRVHGSKALRTLALSRFASAVRVHSARTVRAVNRTKVARAVQVASSKFARTIAWTKVGRAVFTQSGRISRGIGLLAQIVQIGASRATRTVFNRRSASGVQLVSAQITRTRNYGRFGSAVNSYAISTSKSRTWVRRAQAVAVGLASTLKSIAYRSHPGTVVGSWETANVVGSFKTANVTFDTETANVVGTFKTALLTIETETATLYANVEPLQES